MVSAGVLFTAEDEALRTVSLLWLAAAPEAFLLSVEAGRASLLLCMVEDDLRASPFDSALWLPADLLSEDAALVLALPEDATERSELLRVPLVLAYKASPSLLASGRE